MKKIISSIALIISILACQSVILASHPHKKKNVAYYKEKSKRGGSALMLAIAKKTAKDALKGAAIGGTAGALFPPVAVTASAFADAPPHFSWAFDPVKSMLFDRSSWESKMLWKLSGLTAIAGVAVGATSGILYSLYRQRAFSADWAKQIAALKEEDFAENPLIIGQTSYLVSSTFAGVGTAQGGSHYEIYLMPLTTDVLTIFNLVVDALKASPNDKNAVAFVALRLDPRMSYYRGNTLPRIVIGLKTGVATADANEVLKIINTAINGYTGSGIQPRYSSKITPMIYGAFGSGDYKDSPTNHPQFERKGSWFWRTAGDMAYPADHPALSLE
jgi:hypothetical protein